MIPGFASAERAYESRLPEEHDAENHSTYTDEDAADAAREHDRESRMGN